MQTRWTGLNRTKKQICVVSDVRWSAGFILQPEIYFFHVKPIRSSAFTKGDWKWVNHLFKMRHLRINASLLQRIMVTKRLRNVKWTKLRLRPIAVFSSILNRRNINDDDWLNFSPFSLVGVEFLHRIVFALKADEIVQQKWKHPASHNNQIKHEKLDIYGAHSACSIYLHIKKGYKMYTRCIIIKTLDLKK